MLKGKEQTGEIKPEIGSVRGGGVGLFIDVGTGDDRARGVVLGK
jgi:hypothetical protein